MDGRTRFREFFSGKNWDWALSTRYCISFILKYIEILLSRKERKKERVRERERERVGREELKKEGRDRFKSQAVKT